MSEIGTEKRNKNGVSPQCPPNVHETHPPSPKLRRTGEKRAYRAVCLRLFRAESAQQSLEALIPCIPVISFIRHWRSLLDWRLWRFLPRRWICVETDAPLPKVRYEPFVSQVRGFKLLACVRKIC